MSVLICRLCLSALNGQTGNSEENVLTESLLKASLPQIDLEITLNPVACNICMSSLKKLTAFKNGLLEIQSTIRQFCLEKNIDIKTGLTCNDLVALKSLKTNEAINTTDGGIICVLCLNVRLKVVALEYTSIVKMYGDCCFFGYDWPAIKEAVVCVTCVDLLFEFHNFVQMCLKMQDILLNFNRNNLQQLLNEDLVHISTNKDFYLKNSTEVTVIKEELLVFESNEIQFNDDNKKCIVQTISNNSECYVFECTHCEFKTTTETILINHLKFTHNHKEEKLMYYCYHCYYRTHKKKMLRIHVQKEHVVSKNLKCAICNYQTTILSRLTRHNSEVHNVNNKNLYACDLCDYKTLSKDYFNNHLKRKHNLLRGDHQCCYCKFSTHKATNLELHVKKKHKRCDLCDFVPKTPQGLLTHQKNVHGVESSSKFLCNLCDFSTVWKNSFNAHMRAVHCDYQTASKNASSILICPLCEFTTSWTKSIKRHLRRKHSGSVTCKICHKVSLNLECYDRHFKKQHNNIDFDD